MPGFSVYGAVSQEAAQYPFPVKALSMKQGLGVRAPGVWGLKSLKPHSPSKPSKPVKALKALNALNALKPPSPPEAP